MHKNEIETSPELVRRLLTAQFPHWADLPISRVESAGTENALYHLGDSLVVRPPCIDSSAKRIKSVSGCPNGPHCCSSHFLFQWQ